MYGSSTTYVSPTTTGGTTPYSQPASSPCPSCGHCPSCGRGGYVPPFQPWIQPWVYPNTFPVYVGPIWTVEGMLNNNAAPVAVS